MPRLRLTSPADLLAVIPHMLGYQPQGIVAVALKETPAGMRLGVTVRMDTPPEGSAVAFAETLAALMLREQVTAAVLIGYETVTGEALVPLAITDDVFTLSGVHVPEVLTVCAGRWRSLKCSDPVCCPAEGSPLPAAEATPAVEMIAAGSCPAESREALATRVAAGPRAGAVARECARLQGSRDQVTADCGVSAWAQLLMGTARPDALPDRTLAMAALSLHADGAPTVRDTLLAWLAPGLLPIDQLEGACLAMVGRALPLPWTSGNTEMPEDAVSAVRESLERLVGLCAALPDEHAAPALSVLATLAWWGGDGTLACLALQRARKASPDYLLAALLDRMVELGIRPGR